MSSHPSVIHFLMALVWVNIFCASDLALNFTTRHKTVPRLKLRDSACLGGTTTCWRRADQRQTTVWFARTRTRELDLASFVFFAEVRKDTRDVFYKPKLKTEERWHRATDCTATLTEQGAMFCKKSAHIFFFFFFFGTVRGPPNDELSQTGLGNRRLGAREQVCFMSKKKNKKQKNPQPGKAETICTFH